MAERKRKYTYAGSVLHYNAVVASNWKAETFAVSEKQARSNLGYQYKKSCGYLPNYQITLPGKVCVGA